VRSLGENDPGRILFQESGPSHIHLLKLTRLLRLARLLQKMDRYSQYSAMILTLLMLSFTLVAHWLACIWYVVADKERQRNDDQWDLGEYTNLGSLHLSLGYGVVDRASIPGRSKEDIFLLHQVQTGSGAHLTSYPVDTEASFSGVKRPGREADHSYPACRE